ncbi:hypothetical protein DPMN_070622 [Dreissena polymorpha]|uniref:Uncharacterized protein n=1 Tax=Dreissena polymorpha TaxID=45954 RepID=A0A9D4BVT0_DREPO|nr:hypothetical protein DPMN_070622 [Dreissena polymorpha]
MVFSDYRRTSSVTAKLQQLGWPSLQERRAHAKVTMMYRIANGLVEVPTSNLTAISSARGDGLHYLVPFARTLLPKIILPRHHLPLEQPSPVSSQLRNHRQLQDDSATSDPLVDSTLLFNLHFT